MIKLIVDGQVVEVTEQELYEMIKDKIVVDNNDVTNNEVMSKNFDSKELAIELNKLSYEDILIYKENSNIVSKELCYENESKKLTAILDKLLKK